LPNHLFSYKDMSPQTLIGIDFSGAQDAGNHIWLTILKNTESGGVVQACLPARELPDSSSSREHCLPALRQFIASQSDDTLIGMDFPFSLPEVMIPEQNWEAFALRFGSRFPTPDSFREYCRRFSPHAELKRQTDKNARVPFSPYNLRGYRQTYYGIRYLLAPLVKAQQAGVIPMFTASADHPRILETCPASYLKRLGLYAPYKGRKQPERQQREMLLKEVVSRNRMQFTDESIPEVLVTNSGGDALDSLLAACVLVELSRNWAVVEDSIQVHNPVEGWVYC